MSARILAAVLSPLAVILGPHLFALLGMAVIVTALLGIGYCIARVAAETGLGICPVARARPT